MPLSIRLLSDADLETANAVLESAFQRTGNWVGDLRIFRKIQSDGCFLACQDGIPAGMVAATIYSTFAYVGLMGVHQDFQRQGIGLALMQHLLNWLEQRNVPLVRLDASLAGQPLYEKLGFRAFDPVYVFQQRCGQPSGQCPQVAQILLPQDLHLIANIDAQVFGADRSKLLQAFLEVYPGRAFALRDGQGQVDGYLFAQGKRIGPWIARREIQAEKLLRAALSLEFDGLASVIVPESSTPAIALLKRYGFELAGGNRQMALGSNAPVGQPSEIFAKASLSFG